ncbi:putative cystine knot [Helianthus anomalus]
MICSPICTRCNLGRECHLWQYTYCSGCCTLGDKPSERRREICFKGSVLNTCLNQNHQCFCLSCSGVSIS